VREDDAEARVSAGTRNTLRVARSSRRAGREITLDRYGLGMEAPQET
jgi:hypothetical protein